MSVLARLPLPAVQPGQMPGASPPGGALFSKQCLLTVTCSSWDLVARIWGRTLLSVAPPRAGSHWAQLVRGLDLTSGIGSYHFLVDFVWDSFSILKTFVNRLPVWV